MPNAVIVLAKTVSCSNSQDRGQSGRAELFQVACNFRERGQLQMEEDMSVGFSAVTPRGRCWILLEKYLLRKAENLELTGLKLMDAIADA